LDLRDVTSGEAMHPGPVGLLEAEKLYVDQPRLKNLCESQTETVPLVIWDVGLGMAANAMAAIRCWESSVARRDLVIVSFDTTLEPLELVVRHQRKFQHVWHGAPKKLLAERSVEQKHPITEARLRWTFHEGSFLDFIDEAAKPRLIYYDPFSSKADPSLWTEPVFSQVRQIVDEVECELITYSASTSVRTALLLAGFYVGRGDETGKKSETTVAVTKKLHPTFAERARLLGGDWVERWAKSSAFAPPLSTLSRDEIGDKLRAHPQFHPKVKTEAGPRRQELVLG
jgi:queuine tRNA-ribosyltransferase